MHSLAFVDASLGQFTADLLLLLLLGINIYLGWRLGLLRRLVAFAGLYVGVLAASNVGNALASTFAPHSLYANAWMFVGVVAFVVLVFEGLGCGLFIKGGKEDLALGGGELFEDVGDV